MIISKRLRAISDFIPDNSFVLDIGCDHALLDIYVTTTKKNVKAIASDINEKPLKQAQENIKKYSAKKVTLSLGDGLSSYKAGVDTVVLSGLGSTTIVSILKNDKEVLKNINRIIVSSNNDYYFLRKSICELGFYIKEETIISEKNKFYPIIVFGKGNEFYTEYEYKYGPILLETMPIEFQNYLKKEKDKLIRINKSLKAKHIKKRIRNRKEIKYIDKKLSNSIYNNR